jgi:stage V sporulation protein B
LVRFAFPESIALQSAPFARAYTLGLAGLAILGVASSALASLRRELWSMVLTWLAAGLVALSITTLRRDNTFGPELLQATAHATALAMIVAAALGSAALYRAAGALMSPLTLVRVLFSVGVIVAIGTRVPWMGKLMAPVLAAGMAVVYIVLLLATGEIGRADLASIRAVVSRRKG